MLLEQNKEFALHGGDGAGSLYSIYKANGDERPAQAGAPSRISVSTRPPAGVVVDLASTPVDDALPGPVVCGTCGGTMWPS